MRRERISQILGEIDPQYIDEAVEDTGGGKAVAKWLLPMAVCLCIVFVAALAMLRVDKPVPENILQVNTQVMQSLADWAAHTTYYDQLSEVEKAAMIKQFKSYLGLSYNKFVKRIPEEFYQEKFSYIEVYPKGKRKLHDFVLEYRSESGGTARIALSKYTLAVRCVIYECPDPLVSRINGIPVVIIQIQEDYYWTRFSYQGVYYDVETHGISLDRLEELLVGLIS